MEPVYYDNLLDSSDMNFMHIIEPEFVDSYKGSITELTADEATAYDDYLEGLAIDALKNKDKVVFAEYDTLLESEDFCQI